MKVLETVAVGVGGMILGLFVGMCAPEDKKPKFCKDVTSDIGKRLKRAEEKLKRTLTKRDEDKEPSETIVNG